MATPTGTKRQIERRSDKALGAAVRGPAPRGVAGQRPSQRPAKPSGERSGQGGARRGGTSEGMRGAGSGQRRQPPAPRPVNPNADWQATTRNTVQGLGYACVDLERGQRGLLRVSIDRIPGHAYAVAGDVVTVDDCETVTRQLQFALEVEGVDYSRLEVSSPGLDRPLRSEQDYQRFAGERVSVTFKLPFMGRKNFQGLLQAAGESTPGAAGDGSNPAWQLVLDAAKPREPQQLLSFAFSEVREARLVPVLDFKGRRAPAQTGSAVVAGPDANGLLNEANLMELGAAVAPASLEPLEPAPKRGRVVVGGNG